MATDGKVKTLYEDRGQTQAVFPRTKTNAVSDGEGYSLDYIINALQTALDGKAPDGYGLGKGATWTDNLDTATKCGFYNWTEGAQGAPLKYGSVLVINRDAPQGSRIIQLRFEPHMETAGAILIRYRVNSDWTEWEWVTPLMQQGVEYRTTERWKGKAVYTKMVEINALPNNTSETINIGVASSNIIRSFVNIFGSSGMSMTSPYFLADGTMVIKHLFTSTSIQISTTADYTDRSATVQVWYTKE